MNAADMTAPGSPSLLEVPMTVVPPTSSATLQWILRRCLSGNPQRFPRSAARRLAAKTIGSPLWLRPNGRNGDALPEIARRAASGSAGYAMFMLHSSEFMPGGSPTFPDAESIDRLFEDLERLFDALRGEFQGATLSAFHDDFAAIHPDTSQGEG
jgi:hypothetical protein